LNIFKTGDRVKFAPHISPVTRCGGKKAPISMSTYWGSHAMPVKKTDGIAVIIQISGEECDYAQEELVLADT
jgi:hypothetical protein